MVSPEIFSAWAESLEHLSHYEVLRVSRTASSAEVQRAFHGLSRRCHPDRFMRKGQAIARAAAAVFKRVSEAYSVLRDPDARAAYDRSLSPAHLGGPDMLRTLTSLAKTPRGVYHAARAEAYLDTGNLELARVELISATQQEPTNRELAERLAMLHEALVLESDDFL